MSTRRLQTDLLVHAGRLLLEYNESTGAIHRALTATARALTDEPCHVAVYYGSVTVSLAREAPALMHVRELRYNTAVQGRVHTILELVRRGELDPAAALVRLERVEADTPRHSRWVAVLILAAAAACLAALLGADAPAAGVVGLAAGLGLLVRQELGRRHWNLLSLPLSAAFIGAVLGGLTIRLGWTRTAELVLIVPTLMLVPGPHLINGVFDLIDNYLPMSLSRLGLAAGILLASALGIALGVELTIPGVRLPEHGADADRLNLLSDVALTAVVTCGFAVYYNTAWGQVGLAAVGGMVGHGLRFLALDAGSRLEAATFLGGLAVGVVSAWMVRASKLPVAVIAFAGAVTMMPGLHIYRALAGALQLARGAGQTDPTIVADTLGNAFQACLVVSALALGVVVGARTVLALAGEPDFPTKSPAATDAVNAAGRSAAVTGPHHRPTDQPAERMFNDTLDP
jgi:uncharacterized membrane protein YjjP (DUF1212 family)